MCGVYGIGPGRISIVGEPAGEPSSVPPLLIVAIVCWLGLAALAAPLFVHPYLINGLHHAAHFDSIVWTASFVVMVVLVVSAVPLAFLWRRQLRR